MHSSDVLSATPSYPHTSTTPQVDIKRLVTDVLDLSLPLVRKTVRLVNNVGNVPKIVGDTGRIVQVLYNLVGNSGR